MLLRQPAAELERLLYDRAIRAHQLSAPPIFIIGHARSGTTHLHNLLALDPRFAFISYLQTSLPRQFMCITRPELALLRAALPATRGMDNVRMTLESAQEEEMALGILGDICSYKCFYFPRRLIHHFSESVLLENVPAEKLQRFKDTYRMLVKKISYAAGGSRQILFKNPTSTCRIPLLLELFPDARFIHIVRDPHEVFHSMQKLW
ncbi:MAG: sulfotransferase [Verrucomicrobiaceae bacterium]|nr:sulfotransferase [Verrucomicrobiaceae bacterium]